MLLYAGRLNFIIHIFFVAFRKRRPVSYTHLAKEMATADGATDVQKQVGNGLASFKMTADGSITVGKSANLSTGKLTFADGDGKGLTLQIGDTSDSFNQLTVTVKDCHIGSLGLSDIDISSQKGAQDAVKTVSYTHLYKRLRELEEENSAVM